MIAVSSRIGTAKTMNSQREWRGHCLDAGKPSPMPVHTRKADASTICLEVKATKDQEVKVEI